MLGVLFLIVILFLLSRFIGLAWKLVVGVVGLAVVLGVIYFLLDFLELL